MFAATRMYMRRERNNANIHTVYIKIDEHESTRRAEHFKQNKCQSSNKFENRRKQHEDSRL